MRRRNQQNHPALRNRGGFKNLSACLVAGLIPKTGSQNYLSASEVPPTLHRSLMANSALTRISLVPSRFAVSVASKGHALKFCVDAEFAVNPD
jgi:hypothetical protein